MSNITEAIKSILGDVTIDRDGVVSLTRYALCNILGISRDNLTVEKMSQKLVKTLLESGFEVVEIESGMPLPDTAVSIIIEYYAFEAKRQSPMALNLYRAFAAIGIRKFFQEAKGYQPRPKTKLEQLREQQKALEDIISIYEYAENKPGLGHMVNEGIQIGKTALPGFITIQEYLDSRSISLEPGQKAALGMYAATAYRNLTGKAPEKVTVKYRKSDKWQYTAVANYPVDFVPILDNALELGFDS